MKNHKISRIFAEIRRWLDCLRIREVRFQPIPIARPRRHASRRGFTLIETTIALTISSAAMIMLVQINMLAMRFSTEGLRETQLLHTSTTAIEYMTQRLNQAYRIDADTISYRYQIQNSNHTIEFSVPGTGSTVERERFRYDSAAKTIRHERRSGSTFSLVGATPILNNVEEFSVENQEGILSIVVRLQYSIPRYGDKKYTLIGRALPRNL